MIFFEWKKTLFKQKGLILIILMLGLKFFFTISAGYDSQYAIDLNPKGYAYCLGLFKGGLTDEKQRKIEAEYSAVIHATEHLEELSRQLQSGIISKSQYKDLSVLDFEREKNREVFEIVYKQYIYAREAPTERYIMDTRGWNSLLGHTSVDIFLILCLILVLTPLFCNEYESGMEALILSSKRGKYGTALYKLLSGLILGVFLAVLFSFADYTCINGMVGLKNGDYPLKSLEFFKESQYDISLRQALLMMGLNRVLGAALLVMLIAVAGILFKRTVVTLFACSVLVFIPYVLFQGTSILYYLPLPSGLLSGTGYLWGTSYTAGYSHSGTIQQMVKFQRVDKGIYPILLAGYVTETAILFLYGIKRFSGYSLRRRAGVHLYKMLCILFAALVLMTGCSEKGRSQDSYTCNYEGQQNYGETEDYSISLDVESGNIFAEKDKSGEKVLLTRDPLKKERKILNIFVRDGWCYYLEIERGLEGIRIYGIDLQDFSENLVYNSVKENTEDFFGAFSRKDRIENITQEIYKPVNCFFLNSNYIYYKRHSTLVRIDRSKGSETVLANGIDRGLSCSYYNGDVYFLDNQHRLNVYKEKERLVQPIDSVYTLKFEITDGKLIYKDLLDGNRTCYYDLKK